VPLPDPRPPLQPSRTARKTTTNAELAAFVVSLPGGRGSAGASKDSRLISTPRAVNFPQCTMGVLWIWLDV
jgi:hypothetical protein